MSEKREHAPGRAASPLKNARTLKKTARVARQPGARSCFSNGLLIRQRADSLVKRVISLQLRITNSCADRLETRPPPESLKECAPIKVGAVIAEGMFASPQPIHSRGMCRPHGARSGPSAARTSCRTQDATVTSNISGSSPEPRRSVSKEDVCGRSDRAGHMFVCLLIDKSFPTF